MVTFFKRFSGAGSRADAVPRVPGAVLGDTFRKLLPRSAVRNPVMFLVWVGALLALLLGGSDVRHGSSVNFPLAVFVLLAATVVFAAWAEAMAERQARGQADSLRQTRADLQARRLSADGRLQNVPAVQLSRGDRVRVDAGELIPADGEIIEGMGTVNESAVTGESAPVLREAGGDRSGVIAGTLLLTDSLLIEVAAEPGDSFLDHMIALVEGSVRRKTPNELALTVLLAAMSLAFLIVVVALPLLAAFVGGGLDPLMLLALLVCLIPTTIAGLLPAIGIAGINRAFAARLIASSGKAIEVAGDVDTLLIDKTGTITYGNRRATHWHPLPGISERSLAEAAALASIADLTPEGRSVVELAAVFAEHESSAPEVLHTLPFSAQTRLSGTETAMGWTLKGAVDAVRRHCEQHQIAVPDELVPLAERVGRRGATPLAVVSAGELLGIVELSDVVKEGIHERFDHLRRVGVRSVMITGDNPLTAAAIAAQAGVDSFIAEATPEAKLAAIRTEQALGRLVAMVGDGTNDAPALAQADVGLAMAAGTQAAREAANVVDLDSDPSKLIELVEIGKQMLVTRGALTTFSIANDVAKYFAVLPAICAIAMPEFAPLNLMHLHSPQSAIISALIYNALVIPALIPLALRGVGGGSLGGERLLARNLALFGVGGVVLPFLAIKAIDMVLAACGLF